MITINATGDTTLHTAGKYCPEDILVKVPAESSNTGGASIETCTVRIENTSEYKTVIASVVLDGDFKTVISGETWFSCEVYENGGWTISNVICGSTLVMFGMCLSVSVSDGTIVSTSGSKVVYRTSTTANAYITIIPEWD